MGNRLTLLRNHLLPLNIESKEKTFGQNHAAVAIILKNIEEKPEVLLVKRISLYTDPWSGQIAFPGGRYKPFDKDLLETVLRELEEETGVGETDVELLGTLQPISPANVPTLKVRPFVGLLCREAVLKKGQEISNTFWVGLDSLMRRVVTVYSNSIGRLGRYLCYVFDGEVVWGMTSVLLRRIMNMLDL